MMTIKDILQNLHCSSMKSGICSMVHAKVECFVWIVDIELGVDRSHSISRNKGSRLMINTALDFEHIWTATIVDCVILSATQRRHRQGIVVAPDMIPKLLGYVVLPCKEMEKLRRWIMEFINFDFSTQAAYAELWTYLR